MDTHQWKKLRLVFLLSFAWGVFAFWVPTAADACCVYNHTTHPLAVQWYQKHWDSYPPKWTIEPSNKRCTDGEGGEVDLWLMDAFEKKRITDKVHSAVDDHGWISVYKKSHGRWKVDSKKRGGSMKEEHYLEPR